ncbi:hypothetical protein EsDP_00002561 [Epichloe bromicola]|uniref:BNR/Asp-box repeat domain protein n=1 Tax=Epichloe bromicola TaxID=79588 RepID=A0ABQ0CL55_9HYPO
MFAPLVLRLLLLWRVTSAVLGDSVDRQATRDHEVIRRPIFNPPADYPTPRTLYGRTVQLHDGTLLATWENHSPEPPMAYLLIYRSKDKGTTWEPYSKVTDQVNGWGLRYQPFLYVLPRRIGSFHQGTVLLAGTSSPWDHAATKIDLYASRDGGRTWSFASSVARGGRAYPVNGETPVWEPFLMVHGRELICYYSDQRDRAYGQKLVHQGSHDGLSWGPVVNDVTGREDAGERPGMATVAALPGGKWIMTFEYGGGSNPHPEPARGDGWWFPVYYRVADSPLEFASAPDQLLNVHRTVPTSSPYVAWSPAGGANGTIVVTAGSTSGIYINTRLGHAASWEFRPTPQSAAYSRQVMVMNDPDWIHIISAGYLNANNRVTNSVVKLPSLSSRPAGHGSGK